MQGVVVAISALTRSRLTITRSSQRNHLGVYLEGLSVDKSYQPVTQDRSDLHIPAFSPCLCLALDLAEMCFDHLGALAVHSAVLELGFPRANA